jgi:hypothetical protein
MMTDTDEISTEEQSALVEDALAAVRFFYTCHGPGALFPNRVREIADTLRSIGMRRNGQLLVRLADTLLEGYPSAAAIPRHHDLSSS